MAGLPEVHYQGQMGDEDNEATNMIGQRDHGPVPPDDGYTWKKYGQKFIKKVAVNRSYFKCQKSNCGAKKKLEWNTTNSNSSLNVIYGGNHNHPSTNPSTASGTSAAVSDEGQSSGSMDQYNLVYQVFGNSFPFSKD